MIRKRFVLLHLNLETSFYSIVAFSDSYSILELIAKCQPRFPLHVLSVVNNFPSRQSITLTDIKDKNLINICKNVAEYLSVGESAMLKKSYFKSSAWFEKAKNSASLGADIINNY